MSRIHTWAFTAAVLLAVAAPMAASQTPPERSERDRALDEARRSFQGEGAGVDPEMLRKSKANWERYKVVIEREIQRQDEARAQGGAAVDPVLAGYLDTAEVTDTPVDHYLAGRLLGMVGRLDEARVHFDRALRTDPYFYWAHHGLATFFANREMHEPAVKRYQSVLRLNPEHTASRRGLALCLVRLGKRDEAEIQLREILKTHPDEVETLWTLGTLLSEGGRYGESIDLLRRVEQLRPDLPQLRFELARSYARADQVDKAMEIYERAISADATDWRSCMALAEIMHRQGLNHRAAEFLEKGLARLPVDRKADRSELEEKIVSLRARPEKEAIDPNRKSPGEWLDLVLNSVEVERRREAMRKVEEFPWVDAKVPQTVLLALKDNDPEVAVRALKTLAREWPEDDAQSLVNLARIMIRRPDERVRAMSARVLGRAHHPSAVPALIRVLDESSPYVFREIHDGLNRNTFAYIEVDSPAEMDEAARKRLAEAWKAWYQANRDRYIKYEEERKQGG